MITRRWFLLGTTANAVALTVSVVPAVSALHRYCEADVRLTRNAAKALMHAQNYGMGDLVRYKNELYRCVDNIADLDEYTLISAYDAVERFRLSHMELAVLRPLPRR